jgi:glutamate-1-semialdehyde 2,1-aminomutase
LKTAKSKELYTMAKKIMVGGVSSPVRSFYAVNGEPLFIRRGYGSKIYDADENEFIDYVLSWGPLILGHCNSKVTKAVIRSIKRGTSFGAPSEPELMLAEEICHSVPSVERVRFVNSGTEATMTAIRLARAYTSRKKILKFEGCYHGHADYFLTKGGSGLATFGVPDSAGVPEEVATGTITARYNSISDVELAFDRFGTQLAAVIVEPIAGNMGVIPPVPGFLESIRKLCSSFGSVLIFDEVITGFRVSKGGAQALYNVKPDITCLGKIIGGGFPVGAFGGRSDIMNLLSPEGPVYQAGTLSGNPVAMTAGLSVLSLLNERAYRYLERISSTLETEIRKAADSAGIELTVNRVGSMLSLFFTGSQVFDYDCVKRTKLELYPILHKRMLEYGVYLPPSPFETIFLSTAHSQDDIQETADAFGRSFGDFC